ncbi:aspartate/glutamate racemase family protein [Roseococcus sp. DSY-14]|uniref:aspartate/glutamate racemase family protein n=1 Tax=Roseococcus sp. DSY-14 TaxID=3369650 RepID=UPI00387AA6BC
MRRIALIHALRHSPPPVEAAFAAIWPGQRLMNLLDDSLSADLARDGALTPAMAARFLELARYAVGTGAEAILFTCSAFGPCIEAVAAAHPAIPVLKPNEAMIAEVAASGARRVGLLASFPGTLSSMPPEFPPGVKIVPMLAEGALAALDAGDAAAHDRLVAEAGARLAGCDAIALGQFSLAHVAPAVQAATGRPVFSTPGSAVRMLKARLGG